MIIITISIVIIVIFTITTTISTFYDIPVRGVLSVCVTNIDLRRGRPRRQAQSEKTINDGILRTATPKRTSRNFKKQVRSRAMSQQPVEQVITVGEI